MSFEFLRPAGFSPCGVAFGVARHCYTAPCKTYADGPQDNFIRWYYVPDDRIEYEDWTVFTPRIDDAFEATGLEHEKTGIKPNPRKHYSGRDVWHKEGTAVDGDAEDFLGLATFAKHNVGGEPPQEPCLEPEHIFSEIGLASDLIEPDLGIDEGQAAYLQLGGLPDNYFVLPDSKLATIALGGKGASLEPWIARLALGGLQTDVASSPSTPPLFKAAGLRCGAFVEALPLPPNEKKGGLLVGGLIVDVLPTHSVRAGGIQFGGVVDAHLLIGGRKRLHLHLGGIVSLDEASEIASAGLVLLGLSEQPERVRGHLLLGVFIPADPLETTNAHLLAGAIGTHVGASAAQGGSCEEAIPIVFGETPTGSLTDGGFIWYYFDTVGGTSYEMVFESATGSVVCDIYIGTVCPEMNYLTTLTPGVGCFSWTTPEDSGIALYIRSVPSEGTFDYSIYVDLGDCS